MNIQEYIASGVVELYVAGSLCEEDARELESLMGQYPELRQEVARVEQALETYALSQQQQPSAALKDRIMNQIRQPQARQEATPVAAPTPVYTPEASADDIQPLPASRTNWLAIAASLALLLVFGGIAFNFYRKSQSLEKEIAGLKSEFSQQSELWKGVMMDPDNQSMVLRGSDKLPMKMPEAQIKIFWNKRTQQVAVSVLQLPELQEGQQYQLWALKDERPIDAGVFSADTGALVQMLKSIQDADKWAVTVEQKGGSPQPHLDKLCMLSNESGT